MRSILFSKVVFFFQSPITTFRYESQDNQESACLCARLSCVFVAQNRRAANGKLVVSESPRTLLFIQIKSQKLVSILSCEKKE
jgi:hypothetical protein